MSNKLKIIETILWLALLVSVVIFMNVWILMIENYGR